MIECEFCGKWMKSKYALSVHQKSSKACRTLQKLFSNLKKTNGIIESLSTHSEDGIDVEELKEDVEELKDIIEDIKWALRGYINVKKRKKISEEDHIKHKAGYSAVLDELKARFNSESVGSNTSDSSHSIKPPSGAHSECMETENSENKKRGE